MPVHASQAELFAEQGEERTGEMAGTLEPVPGQVPQREQSAAAGKSSKCKIAFFDEAASHLELPILKLGSNHWAVETSTWRTCEARRSEPLRWVELAVPSGDEVVLDLDRLEVLRQGAFLLSQSAGDPLSYEAMVRVGGQTVTVRGYPGWMFESRWQGSVERFCNLAWNEPAGDTHRRLMLSGPLGACRDGSLMDLAQALEE